MNDSKPSSSSSCLLIPEAMQNKIFNCKSSGVYNKWHDKFIKYINENNYPESFESILNFFNEIASSFAVSTLWQAYSCLNKYYTTFKSWTSFNDIPVLKNFLKSIERDSLCKKTSLILAKDELQAFFENAPNEDKRILVRKVVAVIGYYGGLRCAELTALDFKDVAISEECVFVQTMP